MLTEYEANIRYRACNGYCCPLKSVCDVVLTLRVCPPERLKLRDIIVSSSNVARTGTRSGLPNVSLSHRNELIKEEENDRSGKDVF